jgi:metallo-beta-lactamase class B
MKERITRGCVLMGTAFLIATGPAGAQGGGRGAGEPQRIVRGADQPNQNRWNAKSPWGKTERSAPIAAQKKNPFKIFDNVWYVGFQTVSVYLVTTSDGLVLIDSGYAQTVDWLVENIRAAGFDPSNIKYIFVTHSHVDHASGAARMKQITGARVGLSAEDWGALEQQQSGPQQRNFPVPLQRDLVLKDNDAITVGDTTFKFYFTPGHTVGSTSVEYPVRDGGRSYRALTPGGLGLHYAPEWGPTFKQSMERLRALGPWDVALGNHPFLAPVDLEDIERQMNVRRQEAHPAVIGAERVTGFFDAILKIVDEKLVAEPPNGVSPRR